MMYGRGKSSPVIVAGKPANKAEPNTVAAAESVERRAGAKGNANQHPRTGHSAGSGVVFSLASIRPAARLDCQYPRWESMDFDQGLEISRKSVRAVFPVYRRVYHRDGQRPA